MSTTRRRALPTLEEEFRASVLGIRGHRPPPPSPRALEILKAAHSLMCSEGLETFSMRQVAVAVGISLAALQYHFPNRNELVAQMIEYRLDVYEDMLLAHLRGLADNPRAAFVATIDWFLDDAWSADTARFSFHFFALAEYDERANAALGRYQKVYRDFLGLLIRRLEPSLEHMEAVTRGALVASLIDGTMPVAGEGKLPYPELARLRNAIVLAALDIAGRPGKFSARP